LSQQWSNDKIRQIPEIDEMLWNAGAEVEDSEELIGTLEYKPFESLGIPKVEHSKEAIEKRVPGDYKPDEQNPVIVFDEGGTTKFVDGWHRAQKARTQKKPLPVLTIRRVSQKPRTANGKTMVRRLRIAKQVIDEPTVYKPAVCLDFDGVINSYQSGWTGDVTDIPDSPTPGAAEAITKLREKYKILVLSSRCETEEGKQAIQEWLDKHGIKVDGVVQHKPPAIAYVDDNAIKHTSWQKTLQDLERKESRVGARVFVHNQTVQVVKNPTGQQMVNLIDASNHPYLRYAADAKDYYVWSAYDAVHDDMIKSLGLPKNAETGMVGLFDDGSGHEQLELNGTNKSPAVNNLQKALQTYNESVFE